MRETRRPTTRAHAHEALLRLPVEGLRADEARLALRVRRALLDRDRDGLLGFFVGVVLFGTAALFYLFAEARTARTAEVCTYALATEIRLTDKIRQLFLQKREQPEQLKFALTPWPPRSG